MTVETTLLVATLVIPVLSLPFFDFSKDKLISLAMLPSLIALAFSVLSFSRGSGTELLVHQHIKFSTYIYIYSVCIIMSSILSFWLPLTSLIGLYLSSSRHNPVFSRKRMALLYYLMAMASLAAFTINFARVGFDISLMFQNTRLYEVTFARHTAINYLYFLNTPAIILGIFYKWKYKSDLRYSKLLTALLVFISFFHGIKFTVFDTLIFPLISWLYLYGLSKRSILISSVVGIGFLIFFAYFTAFVRQSSDLDFSSFLTYIIPNYFNLFYLILNDPVESIFFFDLILYPFSTLLPLPRELGQWGEFILNDKYNAVPGYFMIFAGIGHGGFYLVFSFTNYFIEYCRRDVTPFKLMFGVLLVFSYLIMFFGYALTKFKYLFYLAVFFMIDIALRIETKHAS